MTIKEWRDYLDGLIADGHGSVQIMTPGYDEGGYDLLRSEGFLSVVYRGNGYGGQYRAANMGEDGEEALLLDWDDE